MLDYNTIEKLNEMKMRSMAASLQQLLTDNKFKDLSFEERVGVMVDAEYTARKNNRVTLLLRKACFSEPGASLEDIEYHADRKLDKALIARLSTCRFIEEHQNIIILGATGSGKTFLANAFGVNAGRLFHTVHYSRLPDLLAELAIAKAEGKYRKAIKAYKKTDLLILDEWLLYPLKESETRDLLEIVNARYKMASTIFCSQFDIGGWHEKIGEPTLADAICDRIVHNAHTIVISGNESMRKRKGIQV